MAGVERVEIGPHVLYLGDCREILPTLSGIDAVVTDPPYGIRHKSHGQRFLAAEQIDGDQDTDLIHWVADYTQQNALCLVCFFSPTNPPWLDWRSVLVWAKGAHVGIGGDRATCWKRDAELIGVARNRPLEGQRDSCVVTVPALSPPPSGHFCEKPVALMQYLVGKLAERTICDPFMGSGSTAEACIRLGKPFVGIESEARWFDYACRRADRAMEDERNRLPFAAPEPADVQPALFD